MAQLKFRLPDELHAQIKQAAERNGVSLNAEIVERMKASFNGEANDGHVRRAYAALWSAHHELLKVIRPSD